MLEALAGAAEREEVEPAELLERLRAAGRLEELREELAARQAIDLIAERAKPIEPEPGARQGAVVDAGEGFRGRPGGGGGRQGTCKAVDPRSLASRGIRSAK